MIQVPVYGLEGGRDKYVGRILFDGVTLSCDPPDSTWLATILAEPVKIAGRVIDRSEPMAFLNALQFKYTGAYCRVGRPAQVNPGLRPAF